MTPEEYIQQLEKFAVEGEADQLLEFAMEHGPGLQDSMTREQRHQASTLAEWAIMYVDLRDDAQENASSA